MSVPAYQYAEPVSDGAQLLALGQARVPGHYERLVKPCIDRLVAGTILLLLLPVLAVIAVGVWAQLGSPVLFRQERVGLRGRPFTMYKFRTMRLDRRVARRAFAGADRRVRHKSEADPRLVPLGRFMRKWSLDEIPQLFNVLLGDMSLVGPRPELVEIVRQYEPWQHRRHEVRPGITGLWQISDRANGVMHEQTALDLPYLELISFATDCKIIAQTVPAALWRQRGH